jgi:hypothetical protein
MASWSGTGGAGEKVQMRLASRAKRTWWFLPLGWMLVAVLASASGLVAATHGPMLQTEFSDVHDHHHHSDHHDHVADLFIPDVGHDATDHDHQMAGLIAPSDGNAFRFDPGLGGLGSERLASIIRDGPRRPPRIA